MRVLWNHLGDKEQFKKICYEAVDKLVKIMEEQDAKEEERYRSEKKGETEK